MSKRCLTAWLLLTACWVVRLEAVEPAPPKPAVPLAQRAWAITEVVLDHHIEPPTRQQMLLAGVRALLAKAGKPAPQDLGRKVSLLTTEEQFAALLKEAVSGTPTPPMEGALIEGLLSAAPGSAHVLSAQDAKAQEVIAANRYVGTGIQIRLDEKEKLTQIVIPFAGGPARRAGSKPGDLIVEVDGKSMAGLSLQEVVTRLRGEEGTAVTALVRQPGASETRLLKMVREVIPFQTVVGYRRISEEGWDFKPDPALPVALLRLTQVNSSTLHELRRAERQLRGEGYRGLVLDLRGAAPGSLVHAAQVADGLLDGGVMWNLRDAKGHVTEYKADRDCLFRDWPTMVLVDNTTVSTGAMIAAALQDAGRAELVGTRTSDASRTNSLVPLPDGTSLTLNTGFVERIKPAKPSQFGVLPDHVVPLDPQIQEALMKWVHAQESPEPPAGKPADDPILTKALALLREKLKDKKEKTAG